MPIESAAALIDVVKTSRLLEAPQLAEVIGLQARFNEPRLLARELIQRGLLTPYQINQLFQGHGSRLVLGQYVLLERLGEGGMGQVFKARHLRLKRLAAVKVIRPERLTSCEAVKRFRREALAAAGLSHPNIVTIYDADEANGTNFLAMEYVEGMDLARLVQKQGCLPVAQACDFTRQVALGLQHAHEMDMVHRDIKPHNLLVTSQGVVKILDMGLARVNVSVQQAENEALTEEGTVLGTADFIAPEQALSSHTVDIRADLYSLGCTLYFLLTGRVPFPGGTLTEKLLRHQVAEPQPIEELRREVPPALAAIVQKLMAKQPADRYHTPRELRTCMSAVDGVTVGIPTPITESPAGYLASPSSKAPIDPPASASENISTDLATLARTLIPEKHKRRLSWRHYGATAGILLLLLIVLLVATLSPSGDGITGENIPRDKSDWPLDNLQPVKNDVVKQLNLPSDSLVLVLGDHRGRHGRLVQAVAYSPDGKLVASGGSNPAVVWKADTLEQFRVLRSDDESVTSLTFTPDNKRLVAAHDRTVIVWDIESAKPIRRLEEHPNRVNALVLSEDGLRLLTGCDDNMMRLWELETGKLVRRFTGHKTAVTDVAFASDRRQVFSASRNDFTFKVWDEATGKEEKGFRFPGPPLWSVAFSRDGQRVLCSYGAACTHALLDLTGKTIANAPKEMRGRTSCGTFLPDHRHILVAEENTGQLLLLDTQTWRQVKVFRGHTATIRSVAVSPNGQRIVSGSEDGTVRVWDVESGKEVVPFVGHTVGATCVALSRDGKYVLTGGYDKTVRLWDLTSDPPGREVRQLKPPHPGPLNTVAFSPSTELALSACDRGTVRIWNPATGEELYRVEDCKMTCPGTSFFPKGARFLSGYNTTLREWNGPNDQQFLGKRGEGGGVGSLALSSDGRLAMSYHRGENERGLIESSVRLWDAETRKEIGFVMEPGQAPLGGGPALTFSRDGQFALCGGDSPRLYDLRQGPGKRPVSFAGLSGWIPAVAYAPNGKLVAASGEKENEVIVWDVATLKPLKKWQMPGAVSGLTFDEMSRYLATANDNGTVFILRLPSVLSKKE